MPTKTKKPARPNATKRHAKHHKTNKQYLKAYWPYVPIFFIIAVGLFLGTPRHEQKPGVLAYATEISSQQLLTQTNQKRIQNNQKSLSINESLSAAAQAKANDMAMNDYWSHYTPDGKAPWEFIEKTGYSYAKAGENLAYGFATSKDTVTGWMNSPTHKANMLDGAFTEVGFGFANAEDFNHSGQETIVVAMYGQPGSSESQVAAANSSTAGFTSASSKEPVSRSVALVQSLTSGQMPWITFAIGLISGFLILFVFLKHGFAVKRALVQGEEFIVKHPVLDIVFVSFIMIGYVLSQSNGFIR